MARVTIKSVSPAATKKIAARLAAFAVKNAKNSRQALVIALNGELGAGKTVFAKGLARGLGLRRPISSPTFIIFRRYPLAKKKNFQNLVHVDAYRLKSAADLKTIDFQKFLEDPENLILIEWANNVEKIIPRKAIRIEIKTGEKEKERVLKIANYPAD